MKAVLKILAGGAGLAALASAAPAAAQYYPNPYGNGSPYGGNVVGQVLNSILGIERYGVNDRVLIDRCAAAVQQRIDVRYGAYRYGGGYGGYGSPYGAPYGYANQGGARVVALTDVDRNRSRVRVRGIATLGAYAPQPYGYPYGYAQPASEFRFKCDVDYRGYIRDIDLDRTRSNYRAYPYRRY